MVGCGSSARAANCPNAILPPELAMISSNSNARSTDCTPDLADDSSANETLRSSIKPSTSLSDKHIPYCEIIRATAESSNDAMCDMSQPMCRPIGSWRLYAVGTLSRPEGQHMTHPLTRTARGSLTGARSGPPLVERPAPLREAVFEALVEMIITRE